jgi:heavy metal sensor kinase
VKLPIRARMTAWYAALLGVIIAAVGAFLVVRLSADLTSSVDRTLRPATDQIVLGYHSEGPPEARDVARTVLSGERAAAQVLDPSGRIVVAYGDPLSRAPLLSRQAVAAVLAGRRIDGTTRALGPGQDRFRVVARATAYRGRPAVVVAMESLATVDRSVHRLLILLLIACPAALLATAAGGWWLARRSLRPIEALREAAQEIDGGRLAETLAVPPTGDEVARLAKTLNTMLDRIRGGVEAQHRLVSDTSHELRTPLAAMRSVLDVSLRADDLTPGARRALEDTRGEVDRMTRTVDDLLTLASADEGRLDLAIEPVDVAAVAAGVARNLRPLAVARGITLTADGAAIGLADERRLSEALANLVENAIKYGPEAGTVALRTRVAGDEVVASVDDDGPGIAPELRERVFDRFFRDDPSRTRARGGSGIGLSIVREIARAHGGRAWVEARPGGGSSFSIAVPALPEDLRPPADERTAAIGQS